jgi:hypothetical protein
MRGYLHWQSYASKWVARYPVLHRDSSILAIAKILTAACRFLWSPAMSVSSIVLEISAIP